MHNKICGKVTEHKFGNQSMLRVDVPVAGQIEPFSKLIAVNAIYAITPLSERDAIEYAQMLKAKPLDIYDMQGLFAERIKELVKNGALLEPENDRDDEPF